MCCCYAWHSGHLARDLLGMFCCVWREGSRGGGKECGGERGEKVGGGGERVLCDGEESVGERKEGEW